MDHLITTAVALAVLIVTMAAARKARRVGAPADTLPSSRSESWEEEGLEVRFEETENADGGYRVGVVDTRNLVPKNLDLVGAHGIERLVRQDDLLTGDSAFDSRVKLAGEPQVVLAALNSKARSLVLNLLDRGRLRISDSHLLLDGSAEDPLFQLRVLREMVDLAKTLRVDVDDIPRRLADNATSSLSSDVGVQMTSFRLLVQHYPKKALTLDTARKLCRSASPLRLEAARYLGAPDGVVALKELLADREAAEDQRQAALFLLDSLLTGPELVETLIAIATESPDPALKAAAMRLVGKHDPARVLPWVAERAPEIAPMTLAAAADCLGEHGDAAAEPVLIQCLSTRDRDALAAVVRALGRIGTAAAVEPLLEVARHVHNPGAVRSAARDAVRGIQARLTHAEAGLLSLTGRADREGELSIADEQGKLSVPGGSGESDRAEAASVREPVRPKEGPAKEGDGQT